MSKQKSFLQRFTFLGCLLMVMGLGVGFAGYMSAYWSASAGEAQEVSLSSAFAVGGVGLALFGIGAATAGHTFLQALRARRLKADGMHILAQLIEVEPTNTTVDNQRLVRLRCSFTDARGTTFVFRSGMLRRDPTPFLQDGAVHVYHDPYEMRRYFVDVDASVGLGERLVEL